MSTTTTTTNDIDNASLATSAKFKTFAIVFALSAPVLYVLCDIFGLPLFTYHPATNRVDLGWAPGRSGEGPAMYWYGWTATTILGGAIIRRARHAVAGTKGSTSRSDDGDSPPSWRCGILGGGCPGTRWSLWIPALAVLFAAAHASRGKGRLLTCWWCFHC